jgi:hypothetical protein
MAGSAQRHRGVNSEAPRFIACRRYHAALILIAADDNGQAGQLGARKQLHGNEERVHIDVKNRRGGACGRGRRSENAGARFCIRRRVLRAEFCKLWHGVRHRKYTPEKRKPRQRSG